MERADILIVDDDPQVFKSICRVLTNLHYKTVSANNGEEALRKISEIQFKVIISDIRMSKMDGLELLYKVHELNPDITRVVLSGHTNVELILNLVNKKGIDRYFVKPWENDDLILAINKCIELYDLRCLQREKAKRLLKPHPWM
jgi:DNA-binding NtrC family response regulator